MNKQTGVMSAYTGHIKRKLFFFFFLLFNIYFRKYILQIYSIQTKS